jgi:hypothetical protein
MNIDKRYLELLAKCTPYQGNKILPRVATLGYIMLILGLMLAMADKLFGVGIAGAGVLITGSMMVLKEKEKVKARKNFIEYFEQKNELPPWPESEARKP